MTTSCVPGFDQLTRWSGQACALWSGRTFDEKWQWVQNYFRDHGLMANNASIAALVAQMDASCPVSPAGSLYDGLNDNEAWNDANSNQTSEGERIATDRNFNQTLQTGINAFGNTILGIVQSNNKQTPTFPNNNPVGGFGGLGGFPPGGSGVSGGFNSPYGYGGGAISWTPIIIGGVIVAGLAVLVLTMSNRRS
jgi:hypothetical protein